MDSESHGRQAGRPLGLAGRAAYDAQSAESGLYSWKVAMWFGNDGAQKLKETYVPHVSTGKSWRTNKVRYNYMAQFLAPIKYAPDGRIIEYRDVGTDSDFDSRMVCIRDLDGEADILQQQLLAQLRGEPAQRPQAPA